MTIVIWFSAVGQHIPPLIDFRKKKKNVKMELINGTPPRTQYACHTSGWIQQEIFVEWFRHFISYIKPNQDDPVVLILDHYSHTRNLQVINIAREIFIHIICLPPSPPSLNSSYAVVWHFMLKKYPTGLD